MEACLLTKEQGDLLVATNPTFKSKTTLIEGTEVHQYSYQLAKHSDFFNPIEDLDINALEMRGITFVAQPDGGYERFLFIPKFFNVNETAGWMVDDLVDKEVDSIMDKRDGSAIGFVRLPSGKIVARTKFGFNNPMSLRVNSLLEDNDEYVRFVNCCFDNGLHPLFELTGPDNQIVVLYEEVELKLLMVRDGKGRSFNEKQIAAMMSQWDIPVVDTVEKHESLSELLASARVTKEAEGWVIRYSDGTMAKIKTDWYLALHGLLTDRLAENVIIQAVLNEQIDDIVAAIPESFTKIRQQIEMLTDFVVTTINSETARVVSEIESGPRDCKRSAAMHHSGKRYMSAYMRSFDNLDKEDVYNTIKNQMLKDTYRLMNSRQWLDDYGFDRKQLTLFGSGED